jgi:hypothetical protein
MADLAFPGGWRRDAEGLDLDDDDHHIDKMMHII